MNGPRNDTGPHPNWSRDHGNSARPQPAYHAVPANKNENDDVDARLAAYYADQHTGEGYANANDDAYVNQAISTPRALARRSYTCKACTAAFPTKNDLDYHTHEAHYNYLASAYTADTTPVSYAKVMASIGSMNAEPQAICLDTGATDTLVARSLVAGMTPYQGKSLAVNGITGASTSSETVDLRLYIHSDDGRSKAFVMCKAHIMKRLDAGLLIGMDVMHPEGMVLDCGKGILTMDSHYGFTTAFARSTKKETVAYHYDSAPEATLETARNNTLKCAPNPARKSTEEHSNLGLQTSYKIVWESKQNLAGKSHACRTCHEIYASTNRLHEHLRASGHATSTSYRRRRRPSDSRRRSKCLDEPWRTTMSYG